jgi:geranylgeranyl diphosphate synthase type II
MDFKAYLKKRLDSVDNFLRNYVNEKQSFSRCPKTLSRSMGYSLLAGGKRLRPVLAIASYEASGGRSRNILPVAASLELLHTYSLIHDDLPAMDNDDYRRSKPTNHRVFGEAIAILAGDALLTDSFAIISNVKAKPEIIINVLKELTYACGTEGMVGGQSADVLFENRKISKEQLLYIHTHKTGALIRASVRIGALMAEASATKLKALTTYGEKIGLAFQIVDDILDVTGTKKELGKSTGTDAIKGKNTFPNLYGLKRSEKEAERLIDDALLSIKNFGQKAEPLREIAQYILKRRS